MDRVPPWLQREDDRKVQKHRKDLYEGKVEYVDDPRNNGRVKVRVAGTMSGDPIDIPTLDLPWALPCFMPGSFNVPEVGDTVLVFFRKGDVRFPVYLGVIYGILAEADLNEARIKGRIPGLQDPKPINRERGTASVGSYSSPNANNTVTYQQPAGNDAPLESFEKRSSSHPYVRVVSSSPKGHTIYTVDEPEKEALRIIDRGGQIFEMVSHITEEENEGNMTRRGIGEADSRTHVDLDKFVNKKAKMQLVDINNQRIQFESNVGATKFRIQGIPKGPVKGGGYESEGSGWLEIREVRQEIQAKSELEGYWMLDSGFHAEDNTGAFIDIHNGVVTISGSSVIIEASAEVSITGAEVTVVGPDGINLN